MGVRPLYERSLRILEKSYGSDHESVAYELTSLGKVYLDQGRVVEAEPLLRRGVAVYEKAVGLDHPDAARAVYNLACLEGRKGRRAEALTLLGRAVRAAADAPWLAAIDREPAFATWRDDADFKRIVGQAAKASGA